jgi:fumarate reductase subunit D
MAMKTAHRERTFVPLLWLLFSAGGMASAMVIPALLLMFGFAFPLGWIDAPDHARLGTIVMHPITRLALFGVSVVVLFHWAHRFKYTLYDGLQVKHLNEMINTFCYGGAIVGSIIAGWILWTL